MIHLKFMINIDCGDIAIGFRYAKRAFVFSNSDKKGFHQKRYLSVFHNSWLLASQLLICVLGKISYLQVVESDIFYADPSSVDSPQLSLLLAEVSVTGYDAVEDFSCARDSRF
uniref:Uncharacterized protein n=1 Tax=Heterorhabditis bacteriophora TaxID=37862 RepID=A0A1I7XCK5_HETBA